MGKETVGLHALDLSECFYRLAEQSQDVFWIRSLDYKNLLYVSPAFEAIWGRSVQSLYDRPDQWILSVTPDDRRLLEKKIKERSKPKAGDVYQSTYRIIRPDNTVRWIKDISFPLFDTNKECFGFVGIAEDISKDILHEREIQEAKQKAEMANQVKVDFLAMMSHELRTPLNTILGVTQILSTKETAKEVGEYFQIIEQAGKNLLSLVNDILDFAKLEVGKLIFAHEPLDLKQLILQVIENIRYQANEKRLELLFNYPDKMPAQVLGDAKRIQQIILNLVGNAVKFTEKGYVKVTVATERKSAQKANFVITVSDTGIGISKEKLEFIFEKFSQVDSVYHRKQQGTGLGLAISKELVKKMDGDITVTSELGKGSEFVVRIPLELHEKISESLMAQDDQTPDAQSAVGYALKVLLVEDNSINQRITKIILEELGCSVEIADTGKKVLSQKNKLNRFDLIFMDIGLPDMSGYDVVTTIRQQGYVECSTPIIAMTAHILDRDKQRCYAVGMDEIVEKPIDHDALVATLQYWFTQKQRNERLSVYEKTL